MAGSAKPNIQGLRPEAKYKILEVKASSGSGGTVDSCGLFDEIVVDGWDTPNVFYWQKQTNYIIIEIYSDSNIWRSGVRSYTNYCNPLTIYKLVDGNYIDVTNDIEQTTSCVSDLQWEKTISNLPKGTYKFEGKNGGLRIDSEWYIEKKFTNVIKMNGEYYSIKSTEYNSVEHKYEPIQLRNDNFNDYSFPISDLFEEITIGDETFKPIEKFNDFQIVVDEEFDMNVIALKSSQEMIATLEPLNMKKYAAIHKITPNYTIDGNGSIKIAFSFDDGVTWKTWDATNDWTDLSNVEVPMKLYENFTDADKTAWSNAQSEINTNGIDITNLSTVTFPTDVKKMCFAIVFNRPTYADTATLTSFDILFDGLKTFVGLDRDKCSVKFSGDTITVTPTSTAEQLLVTMITGTN